MDEIRSIRMIKAGTLVQPAMGAVVEPVIVFEKQGDRYKRTDTQKTDESGIPLWSLRCQVVGAIAYGKVRAEFIEVELAAIVEPEISDFVDPR